MTEFILSVEDVDRLLRLLYNGTRPRRVHTLICNCGKQATLTNGDAAWLGWQILPNPKCPSCVDGEPYTGPARERFLVDLAERLAAGKTG
jgi:hypothetical protein